MSLNNKCHSKLNGIKIGILFNFYVTEIGMSIEFEYHSNWNFTQIEMSLKLECYSKWKTTQIKMSHKLKYHSN